MPETHGIYGGTVGQAEYAHGRDTGRADANALAEGQYGGALTRVAETGGWEYLEHAVSYRTRAYWLGWLRGFREASR